jgi:muramoyltetrapeptide carboxypeptidase
MTTMIKPAALRRGDTIGVVAPAGPVNRERIDRAFARVAALGFRIKTYGDIYRRTNYLAGDDDTRAHELMEAFADPETSAVWCARGGYGVIRLLDRIDLDVVRRNPKVFVGFSDITALHVPFLQRTGLITFHGPNLQDGFGKPDDMPSANAAALWRLLGTEQTVNFTSPYIYATDGLEDVTLRTIKSGAATGPLTGGNLAVLAGMMGTPFEIKTAGRILFLEDVSERVYRIDRYLHQLRLAGKFDSVAGVLLGTFSYDEGDEPDSQTEVLRLITEFFEPFDVPVLSGFPAGHDKFNLALPMGAMVEMDAGSRQLKLLESPVSASS